LPGAGQIERRRGTRFSEVCRREHPESGGELGFLGGLGTERPSEYSAGEEADRNGRRARRSHDSPLVDVVLDARLAQCKAPEQGALAEPRSGPSRVAEGASAHRPEEPERPLVVAAPRTLSSRSFYQWKNKDEN